jgi:hypothetical protein
MRNRGERMTDCIELISMKANGDIYVKGELITNNIQLVDAFNEWRVALQNDTARIHSLEKELDAWKKYAEIMQEHFVAEAIFRATLSYEEMDLVIAKAKRDCGVDV